MSSEDSLAGLGLRLCNHVATCTILHRACTHV